MQATELFFTRSSSDDNDSNLAVSDWLLYVISIPRPNPWMDCTKPVYCTCFSICTCIPSRLDESASEVEWYEAFFYMLQEITFLLLTCVASVILEVDLCQ